MFCGEVGPGWFFCSSGLVTISIDWMGNRRYFWWLLVLDVIVANCALCF